MENKKTLLFAIFNLYIVLANGQLQFQKVIGGAGYFCAGYGITLTTDNGYSLTGTLFQSNHDVFLSKLNNSGYLQWTGTIGDNTPQEGFGIVQTIDGGYAIAGRTNTSGPFLGLSNGYVVKLDSTGALHWAKTIGGYESDEFRSIIETSDANIVVAGYSSTFCFGVGVADFYVVKLNALGDILWTKNIGGVGADYGLDIIETPDGGFAISGYTTSFGQGNADFYCVKLSSTGSLLWTTTIGGADWDWGYSITNTTDGGLAIAGNTSSFGQGGNDVYIVKLTSNGNLQWSRTVGGTGDDIGRSIVQSTLGEYIIAGWTDSYGAGGNDFYLIKLDSSGNLLWTRTIGGIGNDQAYDLIIDSDDGFVIAGLSTSFNWGNQAMYVVKVDSYGNTCNNQATGGRTGSGGVASSGGVTGSGGSFVTGAATSSGGTELNVCYSTDINEYIDIPGAFIISPNPSSGNVVIKFNKLVNKGSIKIFNTIGKNVFEDKISNEISKAINLNIIPGIYFLYVNDGMNSYCKKLIVGKF